ncbi:MAG: hypothetical protein EHM60_00930 [Lysobacterales bacterium]|jgi:hypothetical protein|nr:MAG: hypothetical protein EHM60_00930 [Xanthomonadales bacterium]
MASRETPKDAPDLIGTEQLLRFLDDEPEPPVRTGDLEDTLRPDGVPRITRMPDGIEVVEGRIAQAYARWILQVRCECGRRWFEVEPIDTSKCPRCGALVLVHIEDD